MTRSPPVTPVERSPNERGLTTRDHLLWTQCVCVCVGGGGGGGPRVIDAIDGRHTKKNRKIKGQSGQRAGL